MDSDRPNSDDAQRIPPTRWSDDGLLDQIDIAIYAVDADSRCVRLNPAAERLLGYTQAEVLGRNMHDLVHYKHPDGSPYHSQDCPLLRARLHVHAVQNLQQVLWSKSGEALPVECSASPLLMVGGQTGSVITLKDQRSQLDAAHQLTELMREQTEVLRQRDATARIERELSAAESLRQRDLSLQLERAATGKLREQQALLSAVAETAPIGIAVFDASMHFQWYNPYYQAFLDVPDRDRNLHGTSYFDLIPPKERESMHQIVDHVRETGESFTADEFAFEGLQRGRTYWRWSLSRLENGELMTIAAEITEQVQARREIESIYANAPIALALVSADDYRILRANRRQAEMLGLSADDLTGMRFDGVVGLPDMQSTLDRVAHGTPVYNQVVSGELRNRPGVRQSLLINAYPNMGEDGTVESISIAGSDITAQKRAEDALVEADKLAAVGRLAASISHEINNPLEAVTNLLYLVHNGPDLSAEASEYVKLAESELARVSQIAAQTLRFHRHAIGAVLLTPQQVVEPVVALYQGRLKNSRVRVVRDYRDEGKLYIYEGDVRQILNNLISNAIDAMRDGGVIRVRTRSAVCPRLGLRGTRITVSDSGHGMSHDTASTFSSPFTPPKVHPARGLGLWISHTLAKRHGGALHVRSRKQAAATGVTAAATSIAQSGTTFSLFVPHVREDPQHVN